MLSRRVGEVAYEVRGAVYHLNWSNQSSEWSLLAHVLRETTLKFQRENKCNCTEKAQRLDVRGLHVK